MAKMLILTAVSILLMMVTMSMEPLQERIGRRSLVSWLCGFGAGWCTPPTERPTKSPTNRPTISLEREQQFLHRSEAQEEEIRSEYHNTSQVAHQLEAAQEYTNQIVEGTPTGEPDERLLILQLMQADTLKHGGQSILFFDSDKADYSSFPAVQQQTKRDPELCLVLESVLGEGATREKEVAKQIEMQDFIKSHGRDIREHEELNDIRRKIADAHNIPIEKVIIEGVYFGSFIVKYTLTDITDEEVARLANAATVQALDGRMRQLFRDYVNLHIHPILFRNTFDVAMLDSIGDHDFSSGSVLQVGPPGREKDYHQPKGYIRFGLQVSDGRYGLDDRWMGPHSHNSDIWFRAFHGTGNAAAHGTQPMDAIANIYQHGFQMAHTTAFGPGVYCSPNPSFVEDGYAGTQTIETQKGVKTFMFMLQVAVDPNAVVFHTSNIWTVPHPSAMRPYGILIKEL